MACGTPVVGSAVGGIKFTVRDGETGYLVPPSNVETLAERLAHLYRHPKLMNLLSQQAVRRANDLFTWVKVTEMMAHVYEDVLAAGAPSCRDTASYHVAIDEGFDGLLSVLEESRRRLRPFLLDAGAVLSSCLATGGKVLVYGWARSIGAAQLCTAELRAPDQPRPALAILPLNDACPPWNHRTDEDDGETFLVRQIEAFGKTGDVLLGFSPDDRARGLGRAFDTAHRQGMRSVAILGRPADRAREIADTVVIVPSADEAHVHAVQVMLVHLLRQMIEQRLAAPNAVNGCAAPHGASRTKAARRKQRECNGAERRRK